MNTLQLIDFVLRKSRKHRLLVSGVTADESGVWITFEPLLVGPDSPVAPHVHGFDLGILRNNPRAEGFVEGQMDGVAYDLLKPAPARRA